MYEIEIPKRSAVHRDTPNGESSPAYGTRDSFLLVFVCKPCTTVFDPVKYSSLVFPVWRDEAEKN